MSVIEKLEIVLELVGIAVDSDERADQDAADEAAFNYFRDHGPAIRQDMIDAERLMAYRDATFDGNAVYAALDERAKSRTSADNVADVLDALNRVARATGEGEGNG